MPLVQYGNRLFRLLHRHLELIFWPLALLFLALTASPQAHFSFCLIRLSGIPWCPGCGIGHALGYLLQGHLLLSWEAHPLGAPALFIILMRIFSLVRDRMTTYQPKEHHNTALNQQMDGSNLSVHHK